MGDISDTFYYKVGNCFKTKEEAEKVAEKFRKLLADNTEEAERTDLPKLTAEVFDRPDCPKWAQYAAVNADGKVVLFSAVPSTSDGRWIVIYSSTSVQADILDDVMFDASDWEDSLIKRPVKELPEWCKVGEWVYYILLTEYCKIEQMNEGFMLRFLDGDSTAIPLNDVKNLNPARLRPYNAEKMESLVGAVIKNKYSTMFINAYDNRHQKVWSGYCAYTAERLIELDYTFKGLPCGHLEHLNDKGEWVE